MPEWWGRFESFSAFHGVTVAAVVGGVLGLCAVGRRWRGTRRERVWRRGWSALVLGTQAWSVVWWLLPERFDPKVSLPLQFCDITGWFAGVCLLTRARAPTTVVYFWGLGLSTQGFVTPVLETGVGSTRFWLYWLLHGEILGSALYALTVRGYRPSGRDYLCITRINVAALVALSAINLALGANYGYVGDVVPLRPTLVDHLGPWPWRVLWMFLLGQGVMALLWLPWVRRPGPDAREISEP